MGNGDDSNLPPELRELFGKLGGGEVPDIEEAKAMFGGQLPPGMDAVFAQLGVASQGIKANERALRVGAASRLQQMSTQLEVARIEERVSAAYIEDLQAQLEGEERPTARALLERRIEAATKINDGHQAMLPLLEELYELAQQEASAALGANVADMFAGLFGGPQAMRPGDDLIPNKEEGKREQAGDDDSDGNKPGGPVAP